MPWKLGDDGNVLSVDGKPVYVHGDGKEVGFDADSTLATIGRLNGEAKSHRERAEAAESRYKPFEGIEDAEAARKALATVQNLDAKKLVDAGEVDKIKAEVAKALEAQYAPFKARAEQLEQQLYAEKIGGSFSRSKLIGEKFAIPSDLVQSHFGRHFAIEDGKVVATDNSGNKIYSRVRPGELADFDEALETLVDNYQYKDQILKGSGASGGGATGGKVNAGGAKSVSRAGFEQMGAVERATFIKEGGKPTD